MSKSNWIESSGKTPCRVCGRTHDADCLINCDGKTVLCRTRANPASKVTQPADEVNGYRFKGRFETQGILERAVYVMSGDSANWSKPTSIRNDQTFEYPSPDGSPVARTRRVDDGKGNRFIWQEYWITDGRLAKYRTEGNWVKLSQRMVDDDKASQEDYDLYREVVAKLETLIHLYRIGDPVNKKAIEAGNQIFLVEGEPLVSLLLSLGVPATTNLGGSKKFLQYGGKHGNYKSDLEGARLVLCPDCDKPGIEHCQQITKEMKDADISWLYANPASTRWADPTEGKGYDLKNWIEEMRAAKMQDGDIAEVLYQAIEKSQRKFRAAEVASRESKSLRELIAGGYVDSTAEHWVYENLFEGGLGEWAVLDSTFYKYVCGCWHQVNEKEVSQEVYASTLKLYTVTKDGERKYKYATNATGKSCVEFARQILPPRTLPAGSQYLRVFNNCTVDMRTGEQMPHDRNHYATVAIDADYEPGAECPAEFKDFIEKCYGLDMLPLIRAATNMLLNPSAPWHFFIHLQGPSGSGKGTLSRFWQTLFGQGNYSSCGKLSEIAKPEGRHQYMTGASLLVFPDLNGMLKEVTDFYELVDNGPMSGRALFDKSGYTKIWNTRFVLASVLPLRVENSGEGWDRRQILIPTLGYKLEESYISEQLSQSHVRGSVISWALAMESAERDQILRTATTYNERIEELKQETKMAGDPIQAFVDHCLRPSPGSGKLKSVHLHTYYNAYAKAMGYSEVGEKHFAQRLKGAIGRHYCGRRRAKKGEKPDTEYGFMVAGWIDVELLPGTFETSLGETVCIKNRVEDGGLQAFQSYWDEIDGKCAQRADTECAPSEGYAQAETQAEQPVYKSCAKRAQRTQAKQVFIEDLTPAPEDQTEDHELQNETSVNSAHPAHCAQDLSDVDVEPVSACAQPGESEGQVSARCAHNGFKHGDRVLDLVTDTEALFDEYQGDLVVIVISNPGSGVRYATRDTSEIQFIGGRDDVQP